MRTFHDAVIVEVSAEADAVVIRVEDVTVYQGETCIHQAGRLRVEGLRAFDVDGVPGVVGQMKAGFDDGQILKLSMKEGVLEMLVEWQNYAERRTRTASCRLEGQRIYWDPDPLRPA